MDVKLVSNTYYQIRAIGYRKKNMLPNQRSTNKIAVLVKTFKIVKVRWFIGGSNPCSNDQRSYNLLLNTLYDRLCLLNIIVAKVKSLMVNFQENY